MNYIHFVYFLLYQCRPKDRAHYCAVRTAGAYARAWGSEFVRLQNAGHINIESGLGAWPLGLELLQ